MIITKFESEKILLDQGSNLTKYMSNNYIAISSLAMDLKRVAIAYHNGSNKTAERFIIEANKRKSEINQNKIFMREDKLHLAEDALTYSQIFQNYALTFEK